MAQFWSLRRFFILVPVRFIDRRYSYIVLIMGFYYAPPRAQGGTDHDTIFGQESLESFNAGWTTALTKLWV